MTVISLERFTEIEKEVKESAGQLIKKEAKDGWINKKTSKLILDAHIIAAVSGMYHMHRFSTDQILEECKRVIAHFKGAERMEVTESDLGFLSE